jgi:hypothetical protein
LFRPLAACLALALPLAVVAQQQRPDTRASDTWAADTAAPDARATDARATGASDRGVRPVPPPPRPPRGGEVPIASFPLDGDTRDAAGEEDGLAVGNLRPAEDRSGDPRGAVAFARREYVDLGARTEPEQLTIAAWIRPSQPVRGGAIFSKHSTAVGPRDRWLELRLEDGGRVTFAIPGGARPQSVRSSRAIPAGRWTHVAASFDGTRAVLYLDGARDAEAPLAAFAASRGPVFLGARPQPGGKRAQLGSFLDGHLDDVRLYRGALPDQELRALAGERGGSNPPGRSDDEDDRGEASLVHADRLIVAYDAALSRRDARGIERAEDQIAGELERMQRETRDAGAPQALVLRIRGTVRELHALRGRVDTRSLGRKRGALLGLSEALWYAFAQELDERPIE